jgi:hypothetical protein
LKCPKCKGIGIKEIVSSTVIEEKEYPNPPILTWCLECDGTGELSKIKGFHLKKRLR